MFDFLSFALVGLHLAGLAAALHAIFHARSPQGSVAWALSLVFVPYLTLPLYLVFGRGRFEGYISSRRAGREQIHEVAAELRKHAPEFRSEMPDADGAFRVIELLAAMPFTRGNSARLLIDGEQTFAAMFEGIEAARDYVLLQFFIVRDDVLGRDLKARLVRKVREGVRIYFLYDAVGSHALPATYLAELRAAGIHVSAFYSARGHSRFQINFRNHRKICIVDGRHGYMGGMNIGDEYAGRVARFGRWRDTHIELEGPAVQCMQLGFVEDWYWARREVPELMWEPRAAEGSEVDVLVLPTGPADDFESCGLFFSHTIQAAKQRVWIASPYFVPDSRVISSLVIAGLRGADVRILLPGRPDHLVVWLASFSFLAECERAGVKFFRYSEGFLHQKVMLIDDRVAAVGTANLDNRSFKLNFEITAVVYDRAFASEVERMLDADFACSAPITSADYDARSFLFKLGVRVARLFAPIL